MSVAEVENETEPTEPVDPTEPTEPEPEPEPETPTEPTEPTEPEPEPAPTVTPEQMEKFYKGLATRTATLDRWIEAELGDNYADLSACPLCSDGIVGHIYPPEWIQPVSDLQARLVDVLKTPQAPEYQPAPGIRQCGTCAGWGQVLSGSKVAGKDRIVCPTCKGNGFQGGPLQLAPEPTGNGEVEFVEHAAPAFTVTDDVDIWGSPRLLDDGQENPNYGKMVQYKNPELP